MSLRPKTSAEQGLARGDIRSAPSFTDVADFFRPDVGRTPGVADRAETGQYLSPPPVARLMASSFEARNPTINLLNARAGTGSPSAVFVDELCGRAGRPAEVFVTAFLTRKAMLKYLEEISWETEVWVAGSPDHLIRFNGERFLGPHE
jgi:hypothetical protein